MKSTLLLALSLFITIISAAQANTADTAAQRLMKPLHFITGEWEGKGWMMMADGKKHEFDQTEKVQLKLEGTALLIEGKGKAGGTVIHDAMAVVIYDRQKQHYSFRSYLSSGRSGEYNAEMIGDALYWYPNSNMRYIIRLNEKGQWHEIGEMNRNNEWFRFFEMTLDKKAG